MYCTSCFPYQTRVVWMIWYHLGYMTLSRLHTIEVWRYWNNLWKFTLVQICDLQEKLTSTRENKPLWYLNIFCVKKKLKFALRIHYCSRFCVALNQFGGFKKTFFSFYLPMCRLSILKIFQNSVFAVQSLIAHWTPHIAEEVLVIERMKLILLSLTVVVTLAVQCYAKTDDEVFLKLLKKLISKDGEYGNWQTNLVLEWN